MNRRSFMQALGGLASLVGLAPRAPRVEPPPKVPTFKGVPLEYKRDMDQFVFGPRRLDPASYDDYVETKDIILRRGGEE